MPAGSVVAPVSAPAGKSDLADGRVRGLPHLHVYIVT